MEINSTKTYSKRAEIFNLLFNCANLLIKKWEMRNAVTINKTN